MYRMQIVSFLLPVFVIALATGCLVHRDDESNFFEDTYDWCDDNIDNDGDGATDCEDQDCEGFEWCDGSSDADADSDSDSDSDTDTDADAGSDGSADADVDADADADSDSDVDAG